MENDIVENVSASVVREYLNRKNFRATLKVLDEEFPRDGGSISNRQQLASELNITSLLTANKERAFPLRSMLEVIVRHIMMSTVPLRHGSLDAAGTYSSGEMNASVKHRRGEALNGRRDSSSSNRYVTTRVTSQEDNRSYVIAQPRPCTADLQARMKCDDMVLEESEDGESCVGSGKASILTPMNKSDVYSIRDGFRGQPRALPGPMQSTTHIKDSRRNKPLRAGVLMSSNGIQSQPRDPPSHDVTAVTKHDARSLIKSTNRIKDVLKDDSSLLSNRDLSQLEKIFTTEAKIADISTANRNSLEHSDNNVIVNACNVSGGPRPGSHSSLSSGRSQDGSSTPLEQLGDLELCEIDDLDEVSGSVAVMPPRPTSVAVKSLKWPSKPIDLNTAIKLKTVIFGSALSCFNSEWMTQPFCFCHIPDVSYGLVQHKGGPCGVLASVQAYVLYEMLFGSQAMGHNKREELRRTERSQLLALAIARILWKAGEQERAVVALCGRKEHFNGGKVFKPDGLTEKLLLYSFTKFDNLVAFMGENVAELERANSSGVIQCLYSAIISRTISQVQTDMDDPSGQLMGGHSYCTQEMVNLLLTGRAVSNVFNGVTDLIGDGGHVTRLRGISERSDVGLLSLFEHYQSCEVGTYYKTPRVPIWIVCSESHFSVLYSLRRELMSDWKAECIFDLFYYDGLAKQQDQIKLTIDTITRGLPTPPEPELCPPLELCIRTKWKDAHINWNGSEPIL